MKNGFVGRCRKNPGHFHANRGRGPCGWDNCTCEGELEEVPFELMVRYMQEQYKAIATISRQRNQAAAQRSIDERSEKNNLGRQGQWYTLL